MMKLIGAVSAAFLMTAMLVSASQGVLLPNYKKWGVHKKDSPSLYTTVLGGCESKTIEEIYKIGGNQYIRLKFDEYISPETIGEEVVAIVKDAKGKEWLLIYMINDRMYLFERRLSLFGYKWQFTDELNIGDDDNFELWADRVSAFQLRHCLLFPAT